MSKDKKLTGNNFIDSASNDDYEVNNLENIILEKDAVETKDLESDLEKEKTEDLEEDSKIESGQSNKNSLGFWLGIISGLVVVAQVICKVIFNFEFEVNVVVDIISLILAILVMFGVIKSNYKLTNLKSIKDEIAKNLTQEIEEVANKEDKQGSKDKDAKTDNLKIKEKE